MLEDISNIRILFKNNHIFDKYEKIYQNKQKKTSHILITKI